MAFNGSRNFAGNDIIKIIEQSGKQFGPDINAFTGYQTTVYQLDLASKAQLDTGLTWMRDVADGINFDAQQVEKEKGAILGEFRFSRPENQDLYTKAYLKLIGDSVLADADPLGSEQSVQQATVAGLKSYYQKWYQPHNAELIVVGDVNAAVLAQQLQQQFSNWVSNGDAPTRKQRKFNYDLASNVFTIGDNQSPTLFYVIDRNASDRITKQKQLHQLWLDEVSQALIRQRLSAAFSESAVPVQKVNTFTQWIHHDRFSAGEVVFAPQQRATVETIFLATLRSLRDFGVTQNELESVLVDYQARLNNLDATWQAHKPPYYASNKVLELDSGEIVQDKLNHAKTLQKFIDYVNLKRVNRNLDALLSSEITWVMGKAQSEEQSLVEPRLAQLPAAYAKQGAKPVENDKVIEEFLQPSQSGKILSRVDREANFTVWQLSNGLEVWFQQDPQAGERAYIQYASQGGKAALPKELYAASQLLVDTAVRSGLGEFNGAKLDRFLRKQGVAIFPYINLTQHGLEADSSVDSLPVAFNVIYNIVTELNLAARQLEAVKQQVFQDNRVYLESPQSQFERAINNNTYLSDSRHRFISNGELASVTVEQLQQVHDTLFGYSRNSKLVIVADIEPEQLAPLLVKYIAPIAFKLQPNNELNLGNGYNLNPKPKLEVAAFNEDSVVVLKRIINASPQPRTAKATFAEDMLSKISNMRLYQQVREEAGLDYAPEMYPVIQDGESASDWMIYTHVTP
ncbi:zinc protease insulinase family [Vibrio ponticus]|nr:zinc protease insulinase family [Vibrio ponticus]